MIIMKSKSFFYLFAVAALAFVAAGCKPNNPQPNNSLVGKWVIVDRDGITLEITQSEIMLMPVIPNPTPIQTRQYIWVSSDTIEITQQGWGIYITRNKVIFHTSNSVTIEGWFVGNNEVDAPIYEDVTLVRIGTPQNTDFCNSIQTSDFQQVVETTDEFLATIDNSLSDEVKIETLKKLAVIKILCAKC